MSGRAEALIAALIKHPRGLTRSELEHELGVSRHTVHRALEDLRDEGWVLEDGGRLVVGRAGGALAGLDVGRRHVRAVLTSIQGRMLGPPADLAGSLEIESFSKATLVTLADHVAATAKKSVWPGGGRGPRLADIRALGVGVPAPVEPTGHKIAAGIFLPQWSGDDLAATLYDLLIERGASPDLEVRVGNDANLGALAACFYGPAQAGDILYVKASSGIGAGVLVDRRLFTGFRGFGGEVGHMSVPDGAQAAIEAAGSVFAVDVPTTVCPRCSRPLCVENLASGDAVVRQLKRHKVIPDMHVGDLARAVGARTLDDHRVYRAFADAGIRLGWVLAEAARLLDPAEVVISGLLTLAGEPYLDALRTAFTRALLGEQAGELVVVNADDVERIEVLGATVLAAEAVGLRVA